MLRLLRLIRVSGCSGPSTRWLCRQHPACHVLQPRDAGRPQRALHPGCWRCVASPPPPTMPAEHGLRYACGLQSQPWLAPFWTAPTTCGRCCLCESAACSVSRHLKQSQSVCRVMPSHQLQHRLHIGRFQNQQAVGLRRCVARRLIQGCEFVACCEQVIHEPSYC